MAKPVGSKRTPMNIQAELIELFYTGDSITERKLSTQFGLARGGVHEILQKYKPKQTDRTVVMLISSKLNNEWGQGDYQLKQESPEE